MRMSNLVRRLALVAAGIGTAVVAPTAHAGTPATTPSAPSLLVNTNPSGMWAYDGIYVGGAVWTGTTSLLQSTFGTHLGSTSSLLDLPTMLQYDALWVDQRYQSAPQAAELANLLTYAATGRRVVIVGENATWGPWNAAILGALGGSEGPLQSDYGVGCNYGPAYTVTHNALTAGVASVNMTCGGYAVGGTALFDYNVATLWGPKQNVLTLLDANVFDDRFISTGGAQFRQNVVSWAAAPRDVAANVAAVPEPATVALVGGGLLTLGAAVRRRRDG